MKLRGTITIARGNFLGQINCDKKGQKLYSEFKDRSKEIIKTVIFYNTKKKSR